MERISLLEGLDNRSNKPHVDILVPDGKVMSGTATPGAGLYDAELKFSIGSTRLAGTSIGRTGPVQQGAAREEALASGGTGLYTALKGVSPNFQALAQSFASPGPGSPANTIEVGFAAKRTFVETGTTDGLWLEARTEKEIKSLGVNGLTEVSLRIVVGTPSTTVPTLTPASAIELDFSGKLTITDVSTVAGLVLTGMLKGTLTLLAKKSQLNTTETRTLFSGPFTWSATLTYAGNDSKGSVTLDLVLQQSIETRPALALRLTKTFAEIAPQVTYELALVSTTVGVSNFPTTNSTQIGNLVLTADSDVINAGNPNHDDAETGLDIIQSALVSEPAFKINAEALLFPSLPPATTELTIQAIQDWVAFIKRREEQCAEKVVPPPRSYRVININDQFNDLATAFDKLLNTPNLANAIKGLLDDPDNIKLVVTFAGGSATAQSDLTVAKGVWEGFRPPPGKTIHYAAIGAVGETAPGLQIHRLKTFESAIIPDRTANSASREVTIIPYPESAKPSDADGIMLFFTSTADILL